MRKIICASALVWALCGSASAGDIQNPPVTSQPSRTSASQVLDDGASVNVDDAECFTQIALDLLTVMPSLF